MLEKPTISESSGDKDSVVPAKDVLPLIDAIEMVISQAFNIDPIKSKSLKFKKDCELTLRTHKVLYQSLTRLKQAQTDDYF